MVYTWMKFNANMIFPTPGKHGFPHTRQTRSSPHQANKVSLFLLMPPTYIHICMYTDIYFSFFFSIVCDAFDITHSMFVFIQYLSRRHDVCFSKLIGLAGVVQGGAHQECKQEASVPQPGLASIRRTLSHARWSPGLWGDLVGCEKDEAWHKCWPYRRAEPVKPGAVGCHLLPQNISQKIYKINKNPVWLSLCGLTFPRHCYFGDMTSVRKRTGS